MGTTNCWLFFLFSLLGTCCFYAVRSLPIETTIDCNIGASVRGEVQENYNGEIEIINGIPSGAKLEIKTFLHPNHLQFVELIYSAGNETATIRSTKSLDAEQLLESGGILQYIVVCTENVGPKDNRREITLQDINDNAPIFTTKNYNINISEIHQVFTSVLKVEAKDADISPENNMVSYSFLDPVPVDFEIRLGDGTITLKRPLNYNRVPEYKLTVKAQDFGNNSDEAKVTIHIIDFDTMNPYFNHSFYDATISENMIDTLTISPEPIQAKDGDIGINEKIDYSITSVTPSTYERYFNIDGNSGILSLTTKLDREIIETITINIKAAQQNDRLKYAEALVLVNILDVNDNPPEFDKNDYKISIPENSPNETTFLKITVTDKDKGGFNGTLAITPEDNPFQISADGTITVRNSEVLDREQKEIFTLEIIARELAPPHQERQAVLLIELLDENDNSPTFNNLPYEGKIFKNQSIGMEVVKVDASDLDKDANGRINYKIAGGNSVDFFEIDEQSGQISLLKEIPLAENTLPMIILYVTATDGGSIPRTASVPVNILAPGDSRPLFLQNKYEVTIMEEGDFPAVVVTAKFRSLSPIVPVTVSVLTEQDMFQIDNNGTIRTKAKLDRETKQNYKINISVSDGSLSDYAIVIVNVTDINDNTPTFTGSYPDVHLSEDNKSGTSVKQVLASDLDEGFNSEMSFSLQGGDGKIDIDSKTGLITLVKELDRETQASYNLTVIVSDHGQPSRSDKVNFTLTVDDINDNPPIFTNSKYEVKVRENRGTGDVLLNVTATDLDEGENSRLEYQIVDSPGFFQVNPATGEMSLIQSLDFETAREFSLNIEAKDGGSPSLVGKCTVHVQVQDVNDNAPEFSQKIYSILVLENLQSGADLYTLNVTDKDENGFSDGYFILNSAIFSINKLGVISLKSDAHLDREEESKYDLTVWAVDAPNDGFNASASLNITILDVNDNNPQFEELPQNISVPEGNYKPNSPGKICEIVATDKDIGENGHVTLSVLSTEMNHLFRFQQDGSLVAIEPLDRESKDLYEFAIMASDSGTPQRQNISYIKIRITDINDNAPEFSKSSYIENVLVALAKKGDVVLTVSANDKDLGNNSHISYSFSQSSPYLSLDSDTGIITLARDLSDVTKDTLLNHTVIARDHGLTPLDSKATVVINLMVNPEFGVKFENSTYNFSIAENVPKNTTVGSVKALTGSLLVHTTYTVKSYTDRFSINKQGEVATLLELDREKQDQYTLVIEAVDSRTPPNTAVTMVTIHILDVNDNAPEFSPFIVTQLSVLEGLDGLDLGLFSATDHDAGDNAKITYSLKDDFSGVFRVNSSTGHLLSTQALDRETVESYLLNVTATDGGRPTLFSTVTLNITVEDINDNKPVFNQSWYNVTVKENDPPGVILTVFATDKDLGYNAIIHYMILKNTDSPFYIGELSGRIGTLYPLDYETKNSYTFRVNAFNPGTDYESTVDITVNVEDVNEEGPIFVKPPYYVFVLDNSIAGHLILDINATDENNSNDVGIHYNITEGNRDGLFDISNTNGQITLSKDLTKLTGGAVEHLLKIMATDNGSPKLSNTEKVTVTVVPNNTTFPVFLAVDYQPQPLREKAAPGTVVIQISALYSSQVIYTIEAGNDEGYFSIDGFSGVIKTVKQLKVEDFPVMMHVRAADSAQTSVFSEASVNITVIDENDFPPVFSNSSIKQFLKEEESAPTEVIRLLATDKDSGRNGELTYSILSGGDGKFWINPVNGTLYADVSFDFEAGPVEYQIVVYAEDNGIPEKKRDYCTVAVSIIDINDCPPQFEPVQPMTVKENAPEGTEIGKVTAIDQDTGDNAFIVYNITDGSDVFAIKADGTITVKTPTDYETLNKFSITVTATNNKTAPFHQNQTTVIISVLDVNDNPPVFPQSNYTASVNLTSPLGTQVTSVTATDKDQGSNGVIEYHLLDDEPHSKYFLIENPLKGRIIMIQKLPDPGDYSFTVQARDQGEPSLNSTAIVNVQVVDDRPGLPDFNKTDISTHVKENTGVNHVVYTFAVLDTSGTPVTYTILNGNELGHFLLHASTGELMTTINLDYEKLSKYIITVEANEAGSSSRKGTTPKNIARLTVLVEDVNEEPTFIKKSYSAKVFNTVPYRFQVIRVEASDPDGEDNGILVYSLDGPSSREFDVEEATGQIFAVSLAGKVGTFSFKVQVTDQAGKGLSDATQVDVTVDSSSNNDIVVISIDQRVNIVEKKIAEVKRALEDSLKLNVNIINVYANNIEERSRSDDEETFISFIATDTNSQIIPTEQVKRILNQEDELIKTELRKVFGAQVEVSVTETKEESATSPELIGVIVLSVLLALVITGFVVFVVLTTRRNKQLEDVDGDHDKDTLSISNPYKSFKNPTAKESWEPDQETEHQHEGGKDKHEVSHSGSERDSYELQETSETSGFKISISI
ncbi:protocadherin Fat 4-like [Huso huso]|uniref:Protocadherin Fat 4-like n=1 Tax=Huso huso TaxID=61971 RepID=A0ABR0ZVB7_HUSHU